MRVYHEISMKILIFGTGKFYQERKEKIPQNVEIVAFLDNNTELQGDYIDEKLVVSPKDVHQLVYDKILLMSASENAMKTQLIGLGIKEENILYWEQLFGEVNRGVFKLYCRNNGVTGQKKKILIISTDLDYNGGTIAAFYATKALQDRGNFVILAAPAGNKRFIDEAVAQSVPVVICPALTCMQKEVLFWVRQFDVILVNVLQMALCALEIIQIKPVLWWIHEPEEFYKKIVDRFQEDMNKERLDLIQIYAVSNIAKRNCECYFKNPVKGILPYGIADQGRIGGLIRTNCSLVFAIIGAVCSLKAQDIFIQAIKLLQADEKTNTQFWIIGAIGIDEYSNKIRKAALENTPIKILGKLTRKEIHEVYGKIDVVVCPSLEDSLPITVTEGMMYEKVCIVSDRTGSVQYIRDKENGLICKAGDPADLCEQMRWVIHNREKLPAIGRSARKLYDQYFSMERFGERLEAALLETEDIWTDRNRGK